MNGACHKSKGNRIIEVNENLKRQKQKAYELLNSEDGIKHRKKRCFDVEPVFGNIKQNHRFRRFMLRGKEKVAIEWGLIVASAIFFALMIKLGFSNSLINQKWTIPAIVICKIEHINLIMYL